SLILVLVIAGCTGGSSSSRSSGKEILKITDFDSFPKNTVHPDETLILRATIKNVADVPAIFNVSENGSEILFDYCSSLYTLVEDTGFDILTANGKPGIENMSLEPSEEAIFQWTFKAPSEEAIGANMGLSQTCTFKTQISYFSEAHTISYVYFASKNEIMQRTYTGKDLNLKGDAIETAGPVIVNIIPSRDQPIPTPGQWTFYMNVQNKGEGIVDISDLSINEFDGTNLVDSSNKCDIAAEKLKIYGGKSSRIACTLDTPEDAILLTPKRYETHINYTYKTREDLKIKTEAFNY
ncbi:MAG: hypothetical protein KAS12_00305, partial [Candidatus Aenigmarchaeota archaeon]|nr:hypothetical protein [Candidatus Aenigmarchaeota archaeon]